MWMGFDDTGNEYGIGAMAFVHAYLKGASITCTKFGAEARELGMKGIYTSSNAISLWKGLWKFFHKREALNNVFPHLAGVMVSAAIIVVELVSQGIRVDLSLDSGGNTDLSFGFGNCSGQSNMTGNW
ncbi:MAG: hypothetical protein R2847_10765 [Bacteroidia bacterium]